MQVIKLVKKAASKLRKVFLEIFFVFFPNKRVLCELEENIFDLRIETTNICNANCVFCAYQYQTRKKERIPFDLYKKLVDEYSGMGGGVLSFTPIVGEPLLDDTIVEKIQYARSLPNIKEIALFTNGINLEKIGIEQFLTSGISKIIVSTAELDKEIYKEMYRTDKADIVLKNIENLLSKNNELGKPCEIHIGFRLKSSIEEIMSDQKYRYIIENADYFDSNIFFDTWGGVIKKNDLPKGAKIRPDWHPLKKFVPCCNLYGALNIFSGGKVTLCGCKDFNADSELVIGDTNLQTLNEIYFSAKVYEIRARWKKHSVLPDICKECRDYTPITTRMING